MCRINQRSKNAYALVSELFTGYRLLLRVVMTPSYAVKVTICIHRWNVLSVSKRKSVKCIIMD